nr:LysR family transcriptional regulator [Mesorhizobium sp. WSM4875]
MDFGRLRALRELSVRKTMAATAEALYVSPSAVSQQISLLEQEAGIELIERRGRGVELTVAGRQLVERANRVFAELEAARTDIAELKKVVVGELRVAAFPTVAAALMPRTISALRKSHGQLIIQFDEMEPEEALTALRSWQTDIALIDDLNVPPGLLESTITILPLIDDVFNVMVAPDHPLAGRATVSLEELRDECWVNDTASANYNRMLTESCRKAGFTPNIVARSKGFEVAIALIRRGCAIAIMPGLRASLDLEDVWVCRLTPEIRRHIFIAYRQGEKRSPALQAFINEISGQARSLGRA